MTHMRHPTNCVLALGMILASCVTSQQAATAPSASDKSLGGGCGPTFAPPVAASQYVPGSYAGRGFLTPVNHLGEDIALAEGTAVRAIGDGRIVAYRAAAGYGELVVVIEHDLGEPQEFPNGIGGLVRTQYLLSIYGHLRSAASRGGTGLSWQAEQTVNAGDIVGYVNDDLHNGDGGPHLHLGIRLMSAAEAQAADPAAWFRGYDTTMGIWRSHFGAAQSVIHLTETLAAGCGSQCSEVDAPSPVPAMPDPGYNPAPTDGTLELTWRAPAGAPLYRSTLSGRVIAADGSWGAWRVWNEAWRASSVSALVHLYACESFAFSVEYEQGDTVSWSCVGEGILQGTPTARWNGLSLATAIVRSGGGCGLQVQAPCDVAPPSPDETMDPWEDDTPPAPGGSDESANTISCELLAGFLAITVRGTLDASTLHDSGLPSVGFISIGSDQTGWSTSTTPGTYFAVWNGPSYPHTITVPGSVNRFSLWVGGPSGTRWFNTANWSVNGAGCALVPDGFGGLIITR